MALPPHEDSQHDQPHADEQRHGEEPGDRAPVVGLALLDAEDETEHPDRGQGHADQVERVAVGLQPGDQPPRQHEADEADGHVDEEDPLPAGPVDEQATHQRADERGDARRGAPERHGLPALAGREGAGDDGHRLRGHQ